MARKLNTLSTRLWLSLSQCVSSARMTSSNAFRPCEKCDIEPGIKTPRLIDCFARTTSKYILTSAEVSSALKLRLF